MPRRHSIAAAVLAVALAAMLNEQAPAVWNAGDLITFTQEVWGDAGQSGGALLMAQYNNVYAATSGVFEIGIPGSAGYSMVFTGRTTLNQYLPDAGPIGPLTADLLDPPNSMSGEFGGEMVGLKLNIDFSDAGLLPGNIAIPFGDLVFDNYPAPLDGLNGMSVRQVFAVASSRLGGGPGAPSFTDENLQSIADDLNDAFASQIHVSQFARDHLRLPPSPPRRPGRSLERRKRRGRRHGQRP
jgi:hypothetical protein